MKFCPISKLKHDTWTPEWKPPKELLLKVKRAAQDYSRVRNCRGWCNSKGVGVKFV